MASYTPWGDVLSVAGEEAFTFGYFGSMMDAATGLLYIGNGQYYDPTTGRFLNGGSQMNNLPVIVDPAGMFLAPLSLLPLILGKKKKRGKWNWLVVALIMCVSLGFSLNTCILSGGGTPTEPTMPTFTITVTVTVTVTPTTELSETPTATSTPTPTPTITCTATLTPTATSTQVPYNPQGAVAWALAHNTRTKFEAAGFEYIDYEINGIPYTNCANFVSYALWLGGGLPQDDIWYYDKGNPAWVSVGGLYNYLTSSLGFTESVFEATPIWFYGRKQAKDRYTFDESEIENIYVPFRDNTIGDSRNGYQNWDDFLEATDIQPGDVIITKNYNQHFAHAGLITKNSEPPTFDNYEQDRYAESPYTQYEPMMVDHAGLTEGERSIGDTFSVKNWKVYILHSPTH